MLAFVAFGAWELPNASLTCDGTCGLLLKSVLNVASDSFSRDVDV